MQRFLTLDDVQLATCASLLLLDDIGDFETELVHLLEGQPYSDDVLDYKDRDVLLVHVPDHHSDDKHRNVDDQETDDLMHELELERLRADPEARPCQEVESLRRKDIVEADDRQDDLVDVIPDYDVSIFTKGAEKLGRVEEVKVGDADHALDEIILLRVRLVVVMREDVQVEYDGGQRDPRLEGVWSEEVALLQLIGDAVRQRVDDTDLG